MNIIRLPSRLKIIKFTKTIRQHGAEILIILLLILLPCLFFWRLVAPKPADRLGIKAGDFTEQYFPLRAFTAREWVNGRVPLWNPSLFGGQPALADPQAGALYPMHILPALVLGWSGLGFPIWALELEVIMHFSIAGVGTYCLGRHFARRAGAGSKSARFMGLVASLTFTYGGYLTGFPVQQVTILQVSAWLPWVIWTLSRTLDTALAGLGVRKTLGQAGWTSLSFAAAILAGHPQTVMYIFYLSLAYALFRGFSNHKIGQKRAGETGRFGRLRQGIPPFAPRVLAYWGLSIGLGVGLAAAQLWPTLEFIQHSLRADLSFQAVSRGLPLSELVSVLYPGYFGGSPEYIGILPMILIAVALVITHGHGRRNVFFWLGVGLVAMVLAFGANTFLYPIFYLFAPGFDAVRQQERVFLLYSFAAAILAGYGALGLTLPLPQGVRPAWQAFQRNLYRLSGGALALTGLFIYGSTAAAERGAAVNLFFGVLRHHVFGLILLGGSLLLLALRSRRLWRRWGGMSLVALWIIFNLFSVNWRFNLAPRPVPAIFTPLETSLFLLEHTAAHPQPVRIASAGLLRGGNNAALVLGLEDITGNTPLQLAQVAAFAEQMPAWRYWQLMNVYYVVDERDIDSAGLARRYEVDGVKVFEVGDPFPRARIVHHLIAGDDFLLLGQDNIDLKKTALVAANTPPALVKPLAEPVETLKASTALITHVQPDMLSVQAAAEMDGWLVLSAVDYPGWQATLDGLPTTIYRTNGIFQGIFTPQGDHQIVFNFRSQSFQRGCWISGLSLLIILAFIISSKLNLGLSHSI